MQPAPITLASVLSAATIRLQPWLPEIVLLWLAGVLLAALRPLWSWHTVRRLRKAGVSPIGDAVRSVMERTANRLKVARVVEVLQSTLVKTPVVVGCFRPAILLPLCVVAGLPEPQLELILAHELAHIRRHDYLINLLQTLVETLFFYHPAVWWLSAQIRNERENCCDDMAMAALGSRADYGRALLAIEELRTAPTALSLAARGGSLLARIRRIAGCEPPPRLAGGGSLLILATIVTTIAIFAAVTWGAALPGTQEGPRTTTLGTSPADDTIDVTYMIGKGSGVVLMRPAMAFAPHELVPLARLLERPLNVLPKGSRLTDFRQIMTILPESEIPPGVRSGLREIVVFQSVKPIAAGAFLREEYAVKQSDGRKICIGKANGFVALQYDDRTVITAGSEQAMRVYLAGHLGQIPKWLPANAWESFRNDHIVIAADTAMIRREVKSLERYSPPIWQGALLSISSLWDDATCLAAGARLDGQLSVHAWAATKDADSSTRVRRTAEALKTLTESALRNFRPTSGPDRQLDRKATSMLLEEAVHLLGNVNLQAEANAVQLQTSIELRKQMLDTLMSALVAAAQPPDPSSKNGMMALVEDFFRHNFHDITWRETLEWGRPVKTGDGNLSIRYKYRARIWGGEPKTITQVFTFNTEGQFVSVKDVERQPPLSSAHVYQVDKKISAFPRRGDLSTPEAAFASIYRAYVQEGDAAWPRLSVPSLARLMQQVVAKRPLPKAMADRFLSTAIIEVHVWDKTKAAVIAEENRQDGTGEFHIRRLTLLNGRWLNEGETGAGSIERARQRIEQMR